MNKKLNQNDNNSTIATTIRKIPYIKNESDFSFGKYKDEQEQKEFFKIAHKNIKKYVESLDENEI